MNELVEKLYRTGDLSDNELKQLIESDTAENLAEYADEVRQKYYGKNVFLRGLIEISSYCKNDCYYCGIRRSNKSVERYRLDYHAVMHSAKIGRKLGLRTFVLQGGEDATFSNDNYLCMLIWDLKNKYPDCAVTLSLGERSYESYKCLKEAGADRYLLRHESADRELYYRLHPHGMSFENRKQCLYNLKELGYQVGAGFMVGAPYQTTENIISDIRFMQELQPQMIGIGPFIPHNDTPFRDEKGGTLELTLRLLGILRLMFPKVLLPATTALGSISPIGRTLGLKTGCNVIMPNISPEDARKKYMLYNNKLISGSETAEGISILQKEIESAGYFVAKERGDCII
ncbi:MAG: [FeFe] hydrogenase H-cluster radical SAM maturase HydE [Ruminococcus sp.]|nr:[FeFe] hydrogenase H-cluster radical SAM maturase HydE [Ruminococcus sp.]